MMPETEMSSTGMADDFNIYVTDEDIRPRQRHCCALSVAVTVIIFAALLCASFLIYDGWPSVSQDAQNAMAAAPQVARHAHPVAPRPATAASTAVPASPAAPIKSDDYKIYKIPTMCGQGRSCEMPACIGGDLDLGISWTGPLPSTWPRRDGSRPMESWERACASVPVLSRPRENQVGSPVHCASALTTMPGRNALPDEVRETYEWNSSADETIQIELWGGGGGGAGPTKLQTQPPHSAWICGGGGGAGAAVSFAWELRTGWSYKLEIGRGGAGGENDGGGDGSSSKFWEQEPGKSWTLVAEAGGGYGAGSYHSSKLFSPGGQGGVSWSKFGNIQASPGLDGQSSRSNLEDRRIFFIDAQTFGNLESRSAFANYSTRIPCTGKFPSTRGWLCYHEPDFFLECSSFQDCVGVGVWVDQDSVQNYGSVAIFPGAPQGGVAPHGIGGARRSAGHGGSGLCPFVDFDRAPLSPRFNQYVYHNGRPADHLRIRGGRGSDGSDGLASIRACRTLGMSEPIEAVAA